MSANPAPGISAPRSDSERVAVANELYREFYAQCFWHCPRDLTITEDLIPLVVKGLRAHGGRRGFILSAKLQPPSRPEPTSEGERLECR